MKKLFLTTALLLTLIAPAAIACEEGSKPHSSAVKVNGMVCDFCARALEKIFTAREEVSGIKVDLDSGMVTINYKPNQTMDEATLKKLITDSGYDVVDIKAEC